MIKIDDESTVLSAGDSFGFFPDVFWFKIIEPNMQRDEIIELADAASVKESTTEVVKRKLPSWLNGNSSKKRRGDDNDVTALNDGDMAAVTGDDNTETSNTVVEQNMQDLSEMPPEKFVAEALPLKGMLPATDDNQRMQGGDDVASASSGGDIARPPPTEDTYAELGVVESSERAESSLEPDRNELAMLIEATEAESMVEAEESPMEDSNAAIPEDNALEPEPNEQLELPNKVVESRNDTNDAAKVIPNTSAAENTNKTDDGMPLPNIQIKTEPADDTENSTTEAIDGVPLPKVLIKTESNVDNGAAVAGPSGAVPIKQEVKKEVKTEPDSSADSKVPKRDCCPYGIKCYR